eukprot:14327653-Ditylum_brightwellii.AAC.1
MSEQESKANIRARTYSKDDEICFFNGQYKGRKGSLNSSRSVSGNCVPVMVDMGGGREKATSVSVWSCAKNSPPKPTNFMEAVFMQKLSFEKLTKKLAKELSMLGITEKNLAWKALSKEVLKRFWKQTIFARRLVKTVLSMRTRNGDTDSC